MTLLVRDEEDVIAANLDHHLAQGVSHVIVTDNLSMDATPGILHGYQRRGVATVLRETDDNYAQSTWVTRMARLAAVEHDADWVINSDADEFWWPRSGTLATTLAAVDSAYDVVVAHRTNMVPIRSGAGHFLDRMTYREAESTNAFGQPLPPKVCHRADPEVTVEQGNHAVSTNASVLDDGCIEILHFPLRSYEQFENKIRLGGQAYARNSELPPEVGGTWRHLYAEYLEGRLPAYYASQELDPAEAEARAASGVLVRDTRLRAELVSLR